MLHATPDNTLNELLHKSQSNNLTLKRSLNLKHYTRLSCTSKKCRNEINDWIEVDNSARFEQRVKSKGEKRTEARKKDEWQKFHEWTDKMTSMSLAWKLPNKDVMRVSN